MRWWFALLTAAALVTASPAPAQSTVQLAPGRGEVTGNAVPGLGTYSYDGSGNITAIGTQSFTYDAFGRLATATVVPGRTQSFTYDRYGNLKEIKTTVGTVEAKQPFGVDAATNQLDKPTGAANEITASYDPAGNVTHYDGGIYVYDSLNLLKTSSIGGIDRAYLYTASDERIAVIGINGGIERGADWTIRDPAGRVLRRFSRNPTDGVWRWSEDYIWRGSQLLAAEVPEQEKVRHFHLDHLGTPRIVTGNGGSQLATYEYDPFGLQIPTPTASSGILDNPERLQFTGHERDTATLDYMHARYYAPGAGRFMSIDQSRSSVRNTAPQSWNRYAYARNTPLVRVDPDGRADKDYRLLIVPINIIYSEADYGGRPTVRERTEAGLRRARTDFGSMGIVFKVRRFEAGSLVNPYDSRGINGPVRTSTGDVALGDFFAATKGKELNIIASGRANRTGASDGPLENILLGARSNEGTLSHELGHSLGNSFQTYNLVKYLYTEFRWELQEAVNFTEGFEAEVRATAEEIACSRADDCGGAFEPEQK